VWKLLFWFSDGGWPTNFLGPPTDPTSLVDGRIEKIFAEFFHEHAAPNAMSPISPLLAPQTTPAYFGGLMRNFTDAVSPVFRANGSDPLIAGFFRVMLTAFGAQNVQVIPEIHGQNASLQQQQARYTQSTPTLLSEVSYLQNFTRFTYLNHMVISIVEGYVITISVVISFILVFLIREWVVQQQPGINVGAGFNADIAQNERNQDIEPVNHAPEPRDQRQRVGVRPRRHNAHDNEDARGLPAQATGFDQQADHVMQNRPSPVRDALSPAAEIQRRLTEEPRFTEDFLAIWRRSEGNPDEVLRIIEAEHKTEQMSYWVNSMKILQRTLHESPSEKASSAWLEDDIG
jgi:E3 ubiquitin-protein ligase MARCH6